MHENLEKILSLKLGTISDLLSLPYETRYRTFVQRKKHGSAEGRIITVPCKKLRVVQKSILKLLTVHFHPSKIAHGYVKGRSIVTGAEQHLGANSIGNTDLKDFFGSIYELDVVNSLQYTLPWLHLNEVKTLGGICCFHGKLPQGSPASPILSNMVCVPLDDELDKLARNLTCRVSRISDDISFSTRATQLPLELVRCRRLIDRRVTILGTPLRSLIEDLGFRVNMKKTSVKSRPQVLTVTGLIVSDRVDVPVKLRRKLRAALHQWETRGRHIKLDGRPSREAFIDTTRGYINYLGQVRGKNDPLYKRHSRLFKELLERDSREPDQVSKRKTALRLIRLPRSGAPQKPLDGGGMPLAASRSSNSASIKRSRDRRQ